MGYNVPASSQSFITAPIELFSHQITMLRARLPTLGRSVLARRSFAFTPKVMAEGDTGAIRAGGAAASDAFSKREKASEDKWIREEEERTSTHEGARVVHRRDDEDLWQRRREELKSWQDEAVSLSINYRQHV